MACSADCWWAFLACGVGLLAGFQGVHERYPADSTLAAFWNWWGVLYLASRGAVPAAAFIVSYQSTRDSMPPWALAIVCGTGSELILRSRFYIQAKKIDGERVEEIAKGPFDLLTWYQGFFLERIGPYVMDYREREVAAHIPAGLSLAQLCSRVRAKSNLLTNEHERSNVLAAVEAAEKELAAGGAAIGEESLHKLILGYKLRNLVGDRTFRMLMSEPIQSAGPPSGTGHPPPG